MNQSQLGALLGISPEEVEEMETASSLNLDSRTIRILCETFNTFPRDFIYDSDREFWERAMKLGGHEAGDYVSSFLSTPVASDVVSRELGESGFGMLGMLMEVNFEGVKRVREYVEDLIKIDEYLK